MNNRTKQDAHLAWLLHEVRPEWQITDTDETGTKTATAPATILGTLHKLQERPLAVVAIAALMAAHTRPDQNTPAVIAMDGPHWHAIREWEPTPTPPVYQPDTGPIATPDVAHGYAEQIRDTLRSTR